MRTPFPSAGLVVSFGLVLAVVPAVTACGADADPDVRPAFTVTDSAGVEIAVTAFSEPAPETGWTVDAASETEFGGGGDEVHFTWIRAATQLPDGRVVALDPRLQELFVFAPTGELLTRAGREGDGPGEFKRPGGVLHLGGDTLLVYDSSHMRFSLFDTDGTFLDDRRLEQPDGAEDAARLTLYGAVDAVGDTITLRGEGFAFRSSDSGDYVWENPTLRYTSDGTRVGEVAEPTKMWFYGTPDGPRSRLFGGAQDVAAGNGLVYVGDREHYEVRVYEPAHGLVRIDRLVRPRRPVTDEIVESYMTFLSENAPASADRERMLERMEQQPRADSLPWIQDLLPDASGNVWVMEYRVPGQDSGAVGVFSVEGEWLGAVSLPAAFRPLEIGEDYVLGVRTDELDVPHLVRYGLERDGPPMETAEGR